MTWLILLLLTPTVILVMVLSTTFLLANRRDRKEAEETQMTETEADAIIKADDPWVSLEPNDFEGLEQFKDGKYHLTTEEQRSVYAALLASVEEDPTILDFDRRE